MLVKKFYKTDWSVSNSMAPKVTQEYRETTQARILDAALELFERKGYHETSVDDIVHSSHLSKGAIYGYFDSKEELFERLQGREIAKNLELLKVELAGLPSARARLVRLAEFAFDWRRKLSVERGRMILEFSAASIRMKGVRNGMEARYDRLRSLISPVLDEGVINGEFRRDLDTDSVITILIAITDGLLMRWSSTGEMKDWAKVRRALVVLLLEGIASHSGRGGT